jgi:hypothetical protein
MLNFAERTGCGAVIVVWSFLPKSGQRLPIKHKISKKIFNFRNVLKPLNLPISAWARSYEECRYMNCSTLLAFYIFRVVAGWLIANVTHVCLVTYLRRIVPYLYRNKIKKREV